MNEEGDPPLKQQQQQQPPKASPRLQPAIRTPPRSPLPSFGSMGTSTNQMLLPRPSAVDNGSRGVSWDPQAGTTTQYRGSSSPKPPSSQQHHPQHQQHHQQQPSLNNMIHLNDVLRVTPELEAETNLLRAVEKIAGQAHHRTNTETARLFNTIAADELTSAHLMTAPTVAGGGNRSRANTGNSVLTTGEETNNNTNKPPPSPSTTTKAAAATATAGGGTTAKAKFRGLVQQMQKEQKSSSSVEQTLFGLSNALAEMNKLSRGSTTKNEQEDDDMSNNNFDTPLTATDKLLQTVDNAIMNSTNKGKENKSNNPMNDVESGGPVTVLTGDAASWAMNSKSENQLDSNNNNNNNDDDDNAPASEISINKKKKKKRHKGAQFLNTASDGLKADWELFHEFLGGKKATIKTYAYTVVCFVMLPSILLSVLLFEFVEDPDTDENGNVIPGQKATPSWWILFFGVRQVVTFTMALITQALVIDYLALGSRFSLQWFGPIITLLVVQSKGWPFLSIFWGIYNLILLSGNERYVRHWGYWQDWYGLFNEDNPGGHVINDPWNYTVLRLMIIVGIVVSIKRLAVGLMLGRRTFAHFGQELAAVMKNMVLLGEVATLSREIETDRRAYMKTSYSMSLGSGLSGGWAPDTIHDFVEQEADAVEAAEEDAARLAASQKTAAEAAKLYVQKQNAPPPSPGSVLQQQQQDLGGRQEDDDANATGEDFTASEQVAISELLDSWEEPTRAEEEEQRKITIGAVMQFRQALTFMKRKYPFLPAFGPADTRERCIQSAQQVYDRLLMRTPHSQYLPFETLALLAKDDKGGIDQQKAKELIKIFRPERDGTIEKLDFVKSVDVIYKQLRLLSANVSNSSQIDRAVESIVNVIFYIILGCYVLWEFGEDPLTLFFSFSSVILGFAFMFGASASKFFDGVLFILVQRPYGVGDRIHLSNPFLETNAEGSSCWIVERVTLSTTTLYWAATNERATLSNGAISNLRVINAARSPNSTIFVALKFPLDTPYEKIAIFKAAVEQFLKDRPKEWLAFIGFRPTDVAVDLGYIGYKVIAQHRVGWQLVGQVNTSKAELTTYCLEVAKQLEMRYRSPPLPVDLKMSGTAANALQALGQGGKGYSGQLDQKKIAEALRANSTRNMQHQAFQEGDD